jgi:YfiH family protein
LRVVLTDAMPTAPFPHIGFLTSALLARAGFRHAFFTREGGVSSGAYASLNFSYSVGDEHANVDENFRRAAQVLGVAPTAIYYLSQVHGDEVVHARGDVSRSEFCRLSGDAVVSTQAGLACAIRTADCVPLLFADPETGAVAAVHAGWRGVVRRVVAAALRELERLGAKRENVFVAIGPHISLAGFEIGDDVASELAQASSATDAVEQRPGAKPHASLGRILHAQLVAGGVRAAHIECVGGCTLLEPRAYFSYRRDGAQSGRLLSAIVPQDSRQAPLA